MCIRDSRLREDNYHFNLLRTLHDGIHYYKVDQVKEALEGADVVVCGVSSFGVDWFLDEIIPVIPEGVPMLSVTKGMLNFEDGRLQVCLLYTSPELLERIEALRMACGQPVIITSGVRCEARNEEVGGVSWSFHKKGLAADLYCPGMGVGDLAARAQETGLNILPYYSSGYIHVELPLS